jgi:hypothetical protein
MVTAFPSPVAEVLGFSESGIGVDVPDVPGALEEVALDAGREANAKRCFGFSVARRRARRDSRSRIC